VALIAVAANMFLLAWHPEWWIIRYRDNLVMKVMYWPVFVGVLLISTLFTFL
jgi:polyferredoxin